MKINIKGVEFIQLIPENDAEKAILQNMSNRNLEIQQNSFMERNGNVEVYEFNLVAKLNQ